jgi:predicted nucleic acid-binding protein
MRIFLDANVLFSAAKSEGAVRRIIEMALDAGHECVVDAYVLEEARRNLVAKAPGGVDSLKALLRRLKNVPVSARAPVLPVDLPLPADDRPVLAAAIHDRCHALVTGDRTHFGPLYGKTIDGVAIHSPRSLAEALGLAETGSKGALHAPAAPYRVRRIRVRR